MRLIDADKLLENMKESCATDCNVCGYITFLASDKHCGLIDAQPTAYDIDEVVEQLEEKSYYLGSVFSVNDGKERVKVIRLDRAIEIVKEGAENGTGNLHDAVEDVGQS